VTSIVVKHPLPIVTIRMSATAARSFAFRSFAVLPSLLLLLTLSVSPFDGSIGANALSLPRRPHTCTRNAIRCQSRSTTRLGKLYEASSPDVLDSGCEGDDNLPKLKKKLTREFFSIGFPAFIQLAAEPLAALVVSHRSRLHCG
jgi:hypothetical protein